MKTLQRLGKSLMLPVACLPIAAILLGIGYAIDPSGWGGGNPIAAFLVKAGGALIDNMAILFAIGVAVGMSRDNDGTAALAGLVSWLMVQNLLNSGTVGMLLQTETVNPAFDKINNQFIGILCGIIGAVCYNKFHNTKLPDALSFFSGKRSVAIVTGGLTILVSVVLFFVWPFIYSALVSFGEMILGLGAVGAAIYGIGNRLLIPFGLHHALNSVFWFDIAGINDIGKFLGTIEGAVRGQTGQYMTGFFPVMMFGLPAAALAMYHTSKPGQKKVAGGLLLSAAVASFVTGVTEPLEFAFMFLAPGLYAVHAVLTGVSMLVCTLLPTRAGFAFSAGLIDYILSIFNPNAVNIWIIPIVGIVVALIYYFLFRIIIVKFDLKTPGREDEDYADTESKVTLSGDSAAVAAVIVEGLGGPGNIAEIDNCITRLRTEVKDYTIVDEKKIKSTGVPAVIRPSKTSVQVVVGPQVQRIADAAKEIIAQAGGTEKKEE